MTNLHYSYVIDESDQNLRRLVCEKCGYKTEAFPKDVHKKPFREVRKPFREARKFFNAHTCKTVKITPTTADENLNHRDYYGGDSPYEALKIIFYYNLGFCLGNVLKYIIRAGRKDPTKKIEDLKKAQVYLQREIEHLQSQGEN